VQDIDGENASGGPATGPRAPAFWGGLLFAALLFGGCSSEEPDVAPIASGCNPISADHCFLPWPSSFYLAKDASTRTGYRVAYPAGVLPVNKDGVAFDPTRPNLADGFSAASQPLVYFEGGLSTEGLPTDQDDLASSISKDSAVQLLDLETATRVPLFVELDANVEESEIPALIIRPQAPLKYSSHYAVLLLSGVRRADGQPLEPPERFRRIRDGVATGDAALSVEGARMRELFDFVDAQGIGRGNLVFAWDFHTASREATTGNLVSMVDGALASLPSGGPVVRSAEVTDYDDEQAEPNLLRVVEGEMEAPSYLAKDSSSSWLSLDASGSPVLGKTPFRAPFRIHIPRCAATATGPLPILVFGPGIFGSLSGEVTQTYHKKLIERLCVVEATTIWIGLSDRDIYDILSEVVGKSFSNLPRVTDQLQQAQVNFQTLLRLVQGDFLRSRAMRVGGRPVTDGKTLYYFGVSNGGIQGVTLAALTKEIERFVFNVSGGWWSMMMQRSSDFASLSALLKRMYPSATDRLILVGLSQHYWDATDPIHFAPYLLGTPLTGRSKKKILLQESKDDDQVPNITTQAVARTIGLTQLSPVVEAVYGLSSASAPLDSALAQWSTHPPTTPTGTNTPAPKPSDAESAHKKVRTLESFAKQVEGFLKSGGRVQQTCSGVCDPE
jgi:hypothetical protein